MTGKISRSCSADAAGSSEVLSRKRGLSLSMIRRIHRVLRIPLRA